ncbi:lytic transglycosylase domain-containing protein [Actinophytocola sp.]|uniref:lytic transglycosylase domain-containing protein n=1 Tax=Actinophytocola sp. TaxID=1872138 RepID=UPI002ECFC336
MSAANGRSAERRLRRRRRKLAAATSTVLLVAAAVAGEPISLAASSTQVAGGVGGGLKGMTDPSKVGASGRMNEDDKIGDYLLDNADDPDDLLKLGGDGPTDDQLGIPASMYDAYQSAADTLATTQPNCNLDWSLLASIGRIESNHARGGKVNENGDTVPQILGPVLNGGGFAAIRDSDGGRYDGDNRWDRAVGAMQFIPSTWSAYKADGNGDGEMSPHNVFDATVAAGKYLCSGGLDMSNPQDRAAAVFRYNHSDSYVATVLLWADAYADGVTPLEDDFVPSEDDFDALGPPSVGNNPPPPVVPQNPQNPQQPPPPAPPGTSPDGGPTSSTTTPPTSISPTLTNQPGPTSTPCIPPIPTTTSPTTTEPTPTTSSETPPSEPTSSTTTPPTTTSPTCS